MKPILFIFSGLPASGKSTLAQLITKEYNAVYLRIDTVEQALRDVCEINVQGEGYQLSYRMATDNLQLGKNVVADSCNPIQLTHDEWQETAENCGADFINIEVICSDKVEHRKRVAERENKIQGLALPTWEEVGNREYHPWKNDRILIDTANKSVAESLEEITNKLKQ